MCVLHLALVSSIGSGVPLIFLFLSSSYMNIVAYTLLPFRFSNVTMLNLPSLSFNAYELPIETGAITIKHKLDMANSNNGTAFILCFINNICLYMLYIISRN